MLEHGYTYTTISGRPGEAMRVGTSFYLDGNTEIQVIGAGTDRAFLSIDHGEVSVAIGPRINVDLTDQDVALIRRLVLFPKRVALRLVRRSGGGR